MLSKPGNDLQQETTMRHALVPVHLMQQARPAVTARAAVDAEPDQPTTRRPRRTRRLATRTRSAGA
jgi:hypothetical protein